MVVVYLYDALAERDLTGKVVVTNHIIFDLFKTYFREFDKESKKEMLVNLKIKLTEIANFYIEKLKGDDEIKNKQYKKVKYKLNDQRNPDIGTHYSNTLDGCSYNHIGSLKEDEMLVHQNPKINRIHYKFTKLIEPNDTMCKIRIKDQGRHMIETMQDCFRFFVPDKFWILKTPFYFFDLYRDNKIIKDVNLLCFACVLFSQFPFICHIVNETHIGLTSIKIPLELMWELYEDSQKLARENMDGNMRCFFCNKCFSYKQEFHRHECILKESVIVFSPLIKKKNILMFDGMVFENFGLNTGHYSILYGGDQKFEDVHFDTSTLGVCCGPEFYDLILGKIQEDPQTIQSVRIKVCRPMVDVSSCEKFNRYGTKFMQGLGIDGSRFCDSCKKDSFFSKKYNVMSCGHRQSQNSKKAIL